MDVSILIISYNTRELTLACLKSLYEQTAGIEFEVIVYDNASTDGTADAVAAAFSRATLIRAAENCGFARGNNLAALEARGTYMLLLNPDTVILDGAVQKAVAFARARDNETIVGGRTFFADGSLNYNSCHGGPTPWSVFCIGTGLSSLFRRSRLFNPEALGRWKRDSVREVDAITGCFLLISRKLWNQLQGFDESYFMYGEDTDLCLRAARAGAVCLICPEAKLIHYGGCSEKVRADKMVRLFRAKVQLFDHHWNGRKLAWGRYMLMMWAFTRMCAFAVASVLNKNRHQSFQVWREIWRRRSEFTGEVRAGNLTPDSLHIPVPPN